MIVRIHYTLPNGTEDSIVIAEETVEAIREVAAREVERRNATNPWSEVLEE